ncbi:hypothetical protein NUU61_008265 [Penicillium alfredii]|uniref:Cytochrome b561 domain-containing protein n=1 Tax=Penicillium alfredii TaxID=1506179 RepID=A0A9W9ES30_9EURO|nr:uncharacterized protein NUU61_008265 [Penicillium alfredii]KAJ5086958.1 hypothetical protein NUU61_008265 [Penicillium alfredii]
MSAINPMSPPTPSSNLLVKRDADTYVPVRALIAHGFLMTFAIGLFLPIGATIIQVVPWSKKVTQLHAPLQAFALAMLVAGMGVGIYLGVETDKIDTYHPIIGFIVVGGLLLFQPLMGLLAHLYYRRSGRRSPLAYVHRWWGRLLVILGIVNGGLGFMLAGIGSPGCPVGAVIAYSIIAGIVICAYLAVVVFGTFRQYSSRPKVQEMSKP